MQLQSNLEKVWNKTLEGFAPPPNMQLDEWMDEHYYIPAGKPNAGKWFTLPYQKGIAAAMSDPGVKIITVFKCAQIGITSMYTGYVGMRAHLDKINTLISHPTLEDAQGYSKDDLKSLFEDTAILSKLFPSSKSRNSNDTILNKKLPGMKITLVGSNSGRGYRRISAGLIIFDDVDGYALSAGTEGDQITLGSMRAEFYYNKKVMLISTGTDMGTSRIERSYEASDKRKYYVPCPYCNHKQVLIWGNMDWNKIGTIENPVYICENCHKGITYDYQRSMMENGEWRAEKKFTGHAGFHIWAAYSYSPNSTWHDLVREWHEVQGDNLKLKGFINTKLGQTWSEGGESMDYLSLMAMAEGYEPIMPAGAAVVTASVDVQDDRLEVLTAAWGRDEESWNLDYVKILGSPALIDTWNRLDAFLQKTYPHPNGSQVHIHSTIIDTGGHFASEAYAFVLPRQVRNVVAIKGDNQMGKPLINRPSKKTKKRQVNLVMVGVNTGKDTVYARLKMKTGQGRIHFPVRFGEEYFRGLCSEQKRSKYIRGRQ